jgi:Helicase conserved C-terminal domain
LGYFNSLRVLGSATLQVDADVRDRLKVLAGRGDTTPRKIVKVTELTSRVASSEIPESLKGLEKDLPSGAADDVVLATNMISVGLDIDRLGLMTVMGQPQSSAEYIQATSRVGRKHPGLVVTIFNSARSRDRSHYESFLPFHQSLYRAVEATSATPFAARARDRGLHGVLVALARLLIDDLAPDTSAHLVDSKYDSLTELVKIIGDRVKDTAKEEIEATLDQVDELLEVWTNEAAAKPNMRYNNPKNVQAALLVEAPRLWRITRSKQLHGQPSVVCATLMPKVASIRSRSRGRHNESAESTTESVDQHLRGRWTFSVIDNQLHDRRAA